MTTRVFHSGQWSWRMKSATSAGLVSRATKVAARVSFRQLDASSRWIALDANAPSPAG